MYENDSQKKALVWEKHKKCSYDELFIHSCQNIKLRIGSRIHAGHQYRTGICDTFSCNFHRSVEDIEL